MPTVRLQACAHTIGCKVITSGALVLAFLLYFVLCYIINNLITLTVRLLQENLKPWPDVFTERWQGLSLRFSPNDLTLGY